jgi:hypothetical protein
VKTLALPILRAPVHKLPRLLAIVVAVSSFATESVTAQNAPSIVGGVAGYNSTTGLWKPATESQVVVGFTVGAFAVASTPVGWLSFLAEGAWVQRGSDVTGAVEGQPLTGGVRSDYITVTVQPRASAALGPVTVHFNGGPTLDLLIRSRIDPGLAPVLQDIGTVFGVTGGVGLGTIVGSRYRVEVEARVFEGLGDAYSGPFVSMRNRSVEFVARVGIPRPRS